MFSTLKIIVELFLSNAKAKLIAKAVITFGILFVIWDLISLPDVKNAISAISVPFFLLAALLGFTSTIIGSFRWIWILKKLGFTFDNNKLFRIYFESIALNMVLPGSVSGDAYKVMRLRSDGGRWIKPISSVILERVSNLLTLFFLTALFALTIPNIGLISTLLIAVSLPVLIVAPILFFEILTHFITTKIGQKLWFQEIVETNRKIILNFWNYLSFKLAALSQSFTNFLCLHMLTIDILGEGTSIATSMLAVLASNVSSFLPITLGGYGVREASIILALTVFPVEFEKAVTIAFLFSAILTLLCIPGLVSFAYGAVKNDSKA
ncbi:flippase-like domain-containing protein [Alphaproteobacteria bacterium]|nr:flippase-like domain-containing protein [Alphaproteobacteria bacterium]